MNSVSHDLLRFLECDFINSIRIVFQQILETYIFEKETINFVGMVLSMS